MIYLTPSFVLKLQFYNTQIQKLKTKIFLCKTIRDKNFIALSTRNLLLSKKDLNKAITFCPAYKGIFSSFLQKVQSCFWVFMIPKTNLLCLSYFLFKNLKPKHQKIKRCIWKGKEKFQNRKCAYFFTKLRGKVRKMNFCNFFNHPLRGQIWKGKTPFFEKRKKKVSLKTSVLQYNFDKQTRGWTDIHCLH